jgi:hypothetical protein
MRTIILVAIAAFTLMAPSTAVADEYVFTVPVRLVNAVHVTQGNVHCRVGFREGGAPVNDASYTHFRIEDGSYSGNITVRVTTVRPRASQDAWSCSLQLRYDDTDLFPTTGPSAVAEWYRNRSGRTVQSQTLLVQGGRLP